MQDTQYWEFTVPLQNPYRASAYEGRFACLFYRKTTR